MMNIPKNILDNITKTIEYNQEIIDKLSHMEQDYEDGTNLDETKSNKICNERGISSEMRILKKKIEVLKDSIKTVSLADIYITNSKDHLYKWDKQNEHKKSNGQPYVSHITDKTVEQIMQIDNIDNIWKLLLLMGIGVFSIHTNSKYTEIMKDLAKSKKLYLIQVKNKKF